MSSRTFFDAAGLSGKDRTEIDFILAQTDAAAARDQDGLIEEQIVNVKRKLFAVPIFLPVLTHTVLLKVIKKLKTESKPDGSTYAPPFHKLHVSDERGKAEAIVDVTKDEIVKTLHFDSETGMPQYDPVARKIYVNLQDQNTFAVIDPVTDTVVGRYNVDGCQQNHGMAIDAEHRRAFLSCEGNDTLTVFDLDASRAIAHLPMAKGADVVMFDPGLGRIYVACASGAISVFQMDDPTHFRRLSDVPLEPKIHSLVVDPRTHRVYAPAEQVNGRPAAKMFVFEAVTN